MKTLDKLHNMKTELYAIADKYGASNLRVFGSVAYKEERPDSDIDMLVDWDKYHMLDRIHMQHDLEDLLGRKVDLCVSGTLHWYIKDRILNEAKSV